jgi:hypothetical protein
VTRTTVDRILDVARWSADDFGLPTEVPQPRPVRADHLPEFDILSVSQPATLAYARVHVALKKLGRPIPANDAWIAALGIACRS